MRLLLDTHTLVWLFTEPSRLSPLAHRLTTVEDNELFVSAATAWEICTKVRLGKWPQAEAVEREFVITVSKFGFFLLPIDIEDAVRAGRLPAEHRDPFDRMLAAAALRLDIPILSIDKKLEQFGVRRLW